MLLLVNICTRKAHGTFFLYKNKFLFLILVRNNGKENVIINERSKPMLHKNRAFQYNQMLSHATVKKLI